MTSTTIRANPTNPTLCDEIGIIQAEGRETTLQNAIACVASSTSISAGASSTQSPATTAQSSQQPVVLSSSLQSTLSMTTTGSNGAAVVSSAPIAQTNTQSSIAASTNPAVATSTAGIITPKKGLQEGAVAGVAIGMLLAGALIAGIIFIFLLRRQKSRQAMSTATYSRQQTSYADRNVGPEKGITVVAASVGSIDDLLPQPAEDDAIAGDFSKIRDNIKNHVRTYCHFGPISAADINEAGIRDIATLTGSSAAAIAKTLSDPVTRDIALRFIVASVILTRCTGERSPSLLPNEVAALSASISASNGNNSQSVLFSKWKTVSAALLLQRYGKQSQDPSRAESFQDMVILLDSILTPFVKGSVDGGQRRKNLDMILTRAANFAFLLFAQPGTFRFDFASSQGGLTVFPALVQTIGDQGQLLNPVRVLTEKEVVAV